jgi:hypothetical protein
MSDTTYELLCLIERDITPFTVVAPSTTYIGVLKQVIKKEKGDRLQSVDAPDLKLWKVRISSD